MDSVGASTAEEEALKRNTDCVYFLASPLTCKKGNECDYRHSEGARLNPRDCYYWLNSNCLNPKCAFRHPPLDGLFGPPGSAPALVSTPTLAPKPIPMAHASASGLSKQSRSEQCIFFQKGHCLKGERCPFSHERHSSGNSATHQVVKASPSFPEQAQATFKKESWCIKQCTSIQRNISKASADIELRAPVSSAKPVIRTEVHSSNGFIHAKNLLPKSQPAHALVINSSAWSRSQGHQIHSSDENLQNDLEPGEIVGEYSSGFDAHAANNTKPSVYFQNGNELGRKSICPSDYKPVNMYEKNKYSSSVDKSSRQNGRMQDYYDARPHNILSERSTERSQLLERRAVQRHKSPDEVDRSDLRHRLKQRKLDSSRSTIRSDHYVENKDKYCSQHSQSNQLQGPLESSVSSRLRGRISLPPASLGDPLSLQSEKESDVSRIRRRLSPTRQNERTRRISEDPLSAGARNLGCRLSKREGVESLDFTGPKSLAELKGPKIVESSQEQATNVHNNEDSHSFEGPKPLSALLKRKREDAPLDSVNSSKGGEKNQRNGDPEVSYYVPATENQLQPKVETVEDEEDSIRSRDDELIYDGESSAKDYMEVAIMEDEGLESFHPGDGEYDYEGTENFESHGEEEEDELDDEEDFARKAGLIFS